MMRRHLHSLMNEGFGLVINPHPRSSFSQVPFSPSLPSRSRTFDFRSRLGTNRLHFWYCSNDCEPAATVNVCVGNFPLPPFPAGVPASEVYNLLNKTDGAGILVGHNGMTIFKTNSPVPAGNYTYSVFPLAVVPQEGAPFLKKKPQRSRGREELAFAAVRYFEKLLEPPADLPRTSAELEELLGQIRVKLPIWDASTYDQVGEPSLLTLEFSEEVKTLPSLVESMLQLMGKQQSGLNEATSSAKLYLITGLFIKHLNHLAPLSRKLQNVLVLLDSPNPSSSRTASNPLQRLARPDLQLFVKGSLILRWENEIKYESFPEAVHENSEKLKVWSTLFYGALPYVIGGCCAGNQFRWLKLEPGDNGIIYSEFISPAYDLNSLNGVAAFLHSNVRMHCLLQKLQEYLTDSIKVMLYRPKDRGNGVTITFYPNVVRKEIVGDDERTFTWRQSLYESIEHSKYLIHGKVGRARNTTVLDLEPVGDPYSKPVTLKDLEDATHDILCGLNDLHKAGYTHRDVRWENCIKANVEGEWKWMLIDLEAAGPDGEECKHRERLIAWDDDTLEGTEMKYTKASDLYLLGKLIYQWLGGKPGMDDERYQVMKSRAEKMKERALSAVEVKELFCKRPCKRCKRFGDDS